MDFIKGNPFSVKRCALIIAPYYRLSLAVIVVHTMVPLCETHTHGQWGTRLMVETKRAYEKF